MTEQDGSDKQLTPAGEKPDASSIPEPPSETRKVVDNQGGDNKNKDLSEDRGNDSDESEESADDIDDGGVLCF